MTLLEIKKILNDKYFYVDKAYLNFAEQYVNKYALTEKDLIEVIEDLDFDGFLNFLENYNYDRNFVTFEEVDEILEKRTKKMAQFFTTEDKRHLTLFFHKQNLSSKDVEKIIIGAKQKLDISTRDFLYYNEENAKAYISEVMNEENFKLFKRIRHIYARIYSFFEENNIKKINLSATLKEFYAETENVVSNQDEQTIQNFNKRLDCLEKIMSIYRVMLTNLGGMLADTSDKIHYKKATSGVVVKFGKEKFAKDVGRLADHIMTSSILKLKTNIDAFNANNIQKFIDELQAVGDKDMFTIEEVASLLMEASSILPRATATKLRHVKIALNEYVKGLAEYYSDDPKLSSVTAKALMLKVRSLTIENPKHISEAVKMLFGNSMKDTIASVENYKSEAELTLELKKKSGFYVEYGQKEYMYKFFPNLKIQEVNADTHKYVTTTRGSMLSVLNVGTMYNTTRDLVNSLYRAHFPQDERILSFKAKADCLNKIGYDVNTIYTADNIFDLFPIKLSDKVKVDGTIVRKPSINAKNITNNTQILKIIISPSDIQKIVQHNANFMLQDPEKTWAEIRKIFEDNKTKEEIEKGISEFVNNLVTKQSVRKESSETKRTYKRKNIKLDKSKIEIEEYVFDIDKVKDLIKTTSFEDASEKISKTNAQKVKKTEESSNEAILLEEAIESGDLSDKEEEITPVRYGLKNVLKDRYTNITESELIAAIVALSEKVVAEESYLELNYAINLYIKNYVRADNIVNIKTVINALKNAENALDIAIKKGEEDDSFYLEVYKMYQYEIKQNQEVIVELRSVKEKNKRFNKEEREILKDLYGVDIDTTDEEVQRGIEHNETEIVKTKGAASGDLIKASENLTRIKHNKKVKNLLISAAERMGLTVKEGITLTQELIKSKEKEIKTLKSELTSLETSINNLRTTIKTSLGDKYEKLTDAQGKLRRPHSGIGKLESKIETKEKLIDECKLSIEQLTAEVEILKGSLEEVSLI